MPKKIETIVEEFFKTEDKIPYALVKNNESRRVVPVFSEELDYLVMDFYLREEDRAVSAHQKETVKNTFATQAICRGKERPIWIRVAQLPEAIEVNLNNSQGECARVTKEGWEIKEPTALFYNPSTSKELAKPILGGSWELFKKHFKTKSNEDLMLIIGFMMSCLRPNAPSYPIMVLQGEQGSAKSTTTEMIKMLVDPAKGSKRGLLKKEQDIFIAAKNNHLLSFDNISLIRNENSDTLCRLSTGGSFSCRQLWTNDGEHIIELCKPVLLNGITDFVNRADLSSRSISIELAPIPDTERKAETEVMNEFRKDLPLLLGVLLDGLSSALKNIDSVQLERKPRMADVALWCTAAEEGLGWEQYSFFNAFETNQQNAVITHLSNDPVAIALRSFMKHLERDVWEGTSTKLLNELSDHKPYMENSQSWPSTPAYLSQSLARIAPSLRTIGLNVTKDRKASERTLIIEKNLKFVELHPRDTAGTNERFTGNADIFDDD